jgi:hypothetical protein
MATDFETGLQATQVYCQTRVPDQLRDEIEIVCRAHEGTITIVERRAPEGASAGASPTDEWDEIDVALLRHAERSGLWSLFAPGDDGRWRLYLGADPSESIDPLLAAVETDRGGVFWG